MEKTRQPVFATAEWRKHGWIVPASLAGMILVAIHSYLLGLMFEPLEQEYGWSRAQIAAGPLVTSITTLSFAAYAGKLLDRVGPRKIAVIGVPVFAVCLALISTAGPAYWTWLALYFLLALSLLLIFPSVWTKALAIRFDKNRGMALAIALTGTGVTSALTPIIGSRLIEAYGWRGGYIGMAIISFVVIYPIILWLFDREYDRPAEAVAAMETMQSDDKAAGAPNELRTAKFVRFGAAAFIYSIAATTLGINAVPVLMGNGFDLIVAAEIAGLIGVGTVIGRLGGGLLLDRIDGRWVAIGSGMSCIASVIVLLGFENSVPAASAACLLLGLAAGAEFDACAYLTTKHFDHRNYGALFGVIGGLSAVASGVSPIIANAVYDQTGSYEIVLIAIIPVMLTACVLFFSLGRYPESAEEAPNVAATAL